jgi:hypothetical protein
MYHIISTHIHLHGHCIATVTTTATITITSHHKTSATPNRQVFLRRAQQRQRASLHGRGQGVPQRHGGLGGTVERRLPSPLPQASAARDRQQHGVQRGHGRLLVPQAGITTTTATTTITTTTAIITTTTMITITTITTTLQ